MSYQIGNEEGRVTTHTPVRTVTRLVAMVCNWDLDLEKIGSAPSNRVHRGGTAHLKRAIMSGAFKCGTSPNSATASLHPRYSAQRPRPRDTSRYEGLSHRAKRMRRLPPVARSRQRSPLAPHRSAGMLVVRRELHSQSRRGSSLGCARGAEKIPSPESCRSDPDPDTHLPSPAAAPSHRQPFRRRPSLYICWRTSGLRSHSPESL